MNKEPIITVESLSEEAKAILNIDDEKKRRKAIKQYEKQLFKFGMQIREKNKDKSI